MALACSDACVHHVQVYDELFVDENGAEEMFEKLDILHDDKVCLLYTSPSPRD